MSRGRFFSKLDSNLHFVPVKLQEQIEKDERGFPLKYPRRLLKKWTPVPVVPEVAGLPGEMGAETKKCAKHCWRKNVSK